MSGMKLRPSKEQLAQDKAELQKKREAEEAADAKRRVVEAARMRIYRADRKREPLGVRPLRPQVSKKQRVQAVAKRRVSRQRVHAEADSRTP